MLNSRKRKRSDAVVEAAQLLLDLPLGMPDSVRDELHRITEQRAPRQTWPFVMLNPEQLRTVLRLINASDRPATTLRVWTAAVTFVRMDDGEIMARNETLAEAAEVTPQEVSRALNAMVRMGVLIRLQRGRYAVNANIAWAGSQEKREAKAVEQATQLRLV